MKNNKKLLLTVVVGILILIGVGYFLYGGVDTTTTGPLGNSISFNGTELKRKKWTTDLVCESRKDKC